EKDAIGAHQLELVDPGAVIAFELDLQHLAGVLARDALEQGVQRHDLAGLERAAGAVMVVVGGREAGRARQQQRQQQPRQDMADGSRFHGRTPVRWPRAWSTRRCRYSTAKLNAS